MQILNRGVTAVGEGEVRKKKGGKKRDDTLPTHSVNRVGVQSLTGKSVHLGQRGDTRGIVACYSFFFLLISNGEGKNIKKTRK